MGINIAVFELILLSTVLSKALATIESQERLPANENQPTINGVSSSTNILGSSSAKLAENYGPGKSSRYIIRFARTPSSQIRFSRSPSQIRFGRSQSFVRFGRNGESTDDINVKPNAHYSSGKFIRFARNGIDDLYGDENLHVEPRGRENNDGFIRFGRSQGVSPIQAKNDALRSIHWRNFLRLGRNTNANIRFAGKRDGSSTNSVHHNPPSMPLEMLFEKIARDQKVHNDAVVDVPDQSDQSSFLVNDDEQPDDVDANPDQRQPVYAGDNDLEQN